MTEAGEKEFEALVPTLEAFIDLLMEKEAIEREIAKLIA